MLGLIALPVWWAMGIEQMVWAPIGAIALCKILISRNGRIRAPAFVVWSVLFLLVQAASGFFIVEGIRLITFTRNLGAYTGATLWLIVLVNVIHSPHDARKILACVALSVVGASLVGLLGISGWWTGRFTSPMGLLLPEMIRSTTYGGHIAFRSIGSPEWFIGVGDYFRVDSFFLFPTYFATAIAITTPIVLWLRRAAPTRAARTGWTICIILLSINMAFTTGRIAMASFVGGAIWFFATKRSRLYVIGLLVALSGVLAAAYSETIIAVAGTTVEAAAYARGAGSLDARSEVYRSTVSGFLERPLLGWGTERDVPGQLYPAGSHSTYLGVLYKHGLVGFLCLLGVLVSGWLAMRPTARLEGTAAYELLRFGRWTYVAVLLNGFTDVLDLDATTLILIYSIFGTLIAVRAQADAQARIEAMQ